MKEPQRALQAICYLVSNDFACELETEVFHNETDKKLMQAAQMIGIIYEIAHSEISNCGHTEWEERKEEIIKEYEAKTDECEPTMKKITHCDRCSYETEEGLVITGCAYCGCHTNPPKRNL